MKPEVLIREVRQVGYHVHIKDGDILLTWTKEEQPIEEVITPLLTLLKEQKQAIIAHLSNSEGKVGKVNMPPVKIYSRLFGEEIWLVATKEEMDALASKGVKEVVYMAGEIPLLKEMNKEELITIHSVKKIFPGAGLA